MALEISPCARQNASKTLGYVTSCDSTLAESDAQATLRSVIRPLPPSARGPSVVRTQIKPENRLLTPAEVAAMLRVDPKTVTRWARGGKLSSIRTPGGHRRYSESEVRGFLNGWQHVSLPRASGE
jgi:excisionase family DNA binding protein